MIGDEALRRLVRGRLRTVARRAWEAAIARADPEEAVLSVLRLEGDTVVAGEHRFRHAEKIVVLGWGKAGLPMLRGAIRVLGARIRDGLVVVKDGYDEGVTRMGTVRIATASHPVPDARGEAAARALLDLAHGAAPDELVLVLGSGGGSSLVACPADDLTLADLARVTELLLRSGADIRDINSVRKHLSAFSGGRLAAALRCPSLTLLVSDVPGDDLSAVASGPTVPDPTTFEEALEVVRRYVGDETPDAVRKRLERGVAGEVPETPKPGAIDPSRHAAVVVASNRTAVAAAAETLAAQRLGPFQLGTSLTGDAGQVAESLTRETLARARSTQRGFALVGGGETTVTVTGPGLGGRNQHLACVAAQVLSGVAEDGRLPGYEVVIAAVATDGSDGPGDAAGGIVDFGTWDRARRTGGDPEKLLAAFDSRALLSASGDLVVTGPTRTNVMDLHLCLCDLIPAR